MLCEHWNQTCSGILPQGGVNETNLHATTTSKIWIDQSDRQESHLNFSTQKFIQVIKNKNTGSMPSTSVKPKIELRLDRRNRLFRQLRSINVVQICNKLSFLAAINVLGIVHVKVLGSS